MSESPHALPGKRAVDTGSPDTLMYLILHMYSGPRRRRAHGAISRPTAGHHGLIAGCSYARDIRKAVLRTTATLPTPAIFHDYVEDMTLLATGATPQEAASNLLQSSSAAHNQLTADSMCLNADKQQTYGGSRRVREVLETPSDTPAVYTAKDLGVHHDGYLHKHPVLDCKLKQFSSTARLTSFIPTTRPRRAAPAGPIVFGRCLHGHERHCIMQRSFQQMRQPVLISRVSRVVNVAAPCPCLRNKNQSMTQSPYEPDGCSNIGRSCCSTQPSSRNTGNYAGQVAGQARCSFSAPNGNTTC